ncbi:MAG: DnaD domain protein [Anaerolineales bacterium]|nr:DnaD domain protein [Anaerolineales bacterium]MCW5856617.1 DnaD domain protein [Anaerolineales bacterium]
MSAPFPGFPDGKLRFTRIPGPFFSQLLPQVDDLNELKVLLYAFWKLERMEGDPRYLQPEDFSDDAVFMAGLGDAAALADGLARAVGRGVLLLAELEFDGAQRRFYFLNSPRGREALQAIADGAWKPSGDARYPIELAQEHGNLFSLYEKHIGPITPMLADILKQAEKDYPHDWLQEAIGIAVQNNARSWSYVDAILRRWQEGGKDERRTQGDSEKDRRKYVEGEFSDYIEH